MINPEKILTLTELEQRIRASQVKGESVVLCHGCFDIVHPGHIRHLQHAARQGDRLVVTLSGDGLVNKGDARPLIPQELRAENLAALDCVDWVAINPEPTAAALLARLRPDVYVKGREYEMNHDPRFAAEKDVVTGYGGRVVFSSGDVIFSSTALIAAIEESANPFQAGLRRLLETHQVTPVDVEPIIASFRGMKVAVIGDVIVDTYVLCDRPDVAGESPMMTLRPLDYRRFDGGAAIIAQHLAAMGARPRLVTGMPHSPDAEAMRQRLRDQGVQTHWVSTDRAMIEKQRYLVGATKMVKLDLGEPLTLDARQQQELIDLAVDAAREADAVILADFGQGLFSAVSLARLCETVRPQVDFISGDVSGKRSNLLSLKGIDLVCPSERELRDAVHNYDDGLTSVVWDVLERLQGRAAIVTMGEEGLTAFERRPDAKEQPSDQPYEWRSRLTAEHVPAFSPYAIDQLGCGDALLAAATLTVASGGSLPLAAILGSVAAAAQAQRIGNAVIGSAELRRGVRRLSEAQLTYASEAVAHAAEHHRDQFHRAHA